ncbi:unnamed protein product, partial [Sphacelaria rigidula]
ELRQLLLLLTEKPLPMDAAGGDGRAVCGQVAIVAAIFAVCELLLAWDAGQEISAAVFEPALCSTVLNTALAPVAPGCSPPVWLDVLRCLLDVKKRGLLSRAVALHSVASTQQDSFTLAAAASVWIGGGGPDGLEDENGERSTRQAWIRWYDAELGGLIPTAGTRSGRWLVLSTSAGEDGVELVNVRAGEGWPARTLTDVTWENRGRSPLEAAWNVPAGQSTGSTGGSRLATIVLPPFAAWLRVVLRGDGQRCSETELDGYLRRMAREVYLPCEFGGASNEMARQWLAALIEAEAVAEANTP